MSPKHKKTKKVVFLFAFFALLLVVPNITHAGFFPSISDLVIGFFNSVGAIFQFIFGNIFLLSGKLVDIVFGLNKNIMADKYNVITTGWTIVRDITNLGFVLLTIIMALATVVRFNEYGVRKLLPKLVAMAILVNFSLAGAGILVQFSNNVTSFFIDGATGNKGSTNSEQLSSSLAGVLGAQKLVIGDSDPLPPNPADQGSPFSVIGTAFLIGLTKVIFGVAFTLVATIIMLAFAFMLLLRYIALIFLLILVPFIFLSYVFPGLKKYWDEWWTNFNKWLFFAPAVGFFLYITLKASNIMRKENIIISSTSGLDDILANSLKMLVIGGLLIGSLVVADKAGITGAKMAIGAAKGVGIGMKNFTKNKTMRAGQALSRTKAGAKAGEAMSGKTMKKLSEGFTIKNTDGRVTKVGKKLANMLTGGLRAAPKGIVSAGKSITSTATKDDIKADSFAGSLFKSIKSSVGIKPKEKEKKEKTSEEIKKELDAKIERKRDLTEKAGGELKTVELDKDIKRLKGEYYRKKKSETEAEAASQPEKINEKIGEFAGKEDKNLEKIIAKGITKPTDKLSDNLEKLTKDFEIILSGKKGKGDEKIGPIKNIKTLETYRDNIRSEREMLEKKENPNMKEKRRLRNLKIYEDNFTNKIEERNIELGVFTKERENKEKRERQKNKALKESQKEKRKESGFSVGFDPSPKNKEDE